KADLDTVVKMKRFQHLDPAQSGLVLKIRWCQQSHLDMDVQDQ